MNFWSLTGKADGKTGQTSPSVSFSDAREVQLALLDLRSKDLIPDTVLFLEHEPVITQGRGLQWTGVPRDRHTPVPAHLPQGMTFVECERGGDLTYHGPGQLVIYPIFKLDGKGPTAAHDVTAFLRYLEATLIDCLGEQSLKAQSRENATGIWLEDQNQTPKKIASIGIAVRKWVTYHGVAINCINDLAPFHLISPCGFSPEVMTRLSDWISLDANWRFQLEKAFATRMAKAHSGSASPEIKSIPVDRLQAHLKET